MTRHELIHALECAGLDEIKLSNRLTEEGRPEDAEQCRKRGARFYRLAERLEQGEDVQ